MSTNLSQRKSHKEILNLGREEILKNIKIFMIKNKCFTSVSYKKMNYITFPTLKRKLNIENWNELIICLDLKNEYETSLKRVKKKIINHKFNKKKIIETNQELLEMYIKFSKDIGAFNGASMSQLKKYGFKYSETVLLRRFGSWKNVKEACGYSFKLGPKYSKDEIIELLLKAYKEKGTRLSQKEINQHPNLPTVETILKFFKTTKISKVWDDLKIEKTTSKEKNYTIEEVKVMLYNEYLKKGKVLTLSEIDTKYKKNELPSKSVIYNRFKTTKISKVWEKVLKE